ncbi:MAG: AMP-dependent synthetase and ligase [Rhodospirillaceae bacterium]|nr:MAG: AMP-dependent synthetase and ligase [Rhodospirillaceae bacterium]
MVVPASTLLKEAGLATLLRDFDTMMVVAYHTFADSLNAIRDHLLTIAAERWVVVGEAPIRHSLRRYKDLVATAPSAEPPDAGLTDADLYNIIYSSRTTGDPKSIVHTHYV